MKKIKSETKKVILRRLSYCVLALLNIVIIVGAVLTYTSFLTKYEDKLYDENVESIANLNESAANVASAQLDSLNVKLLDAVKYISKNSVNADAAIEFLTDANSDSQNLFELIGADRTGKLAKKVGGNYVSVDYTHQTYNDTLLTSLQDVADAAYSDACFTPQFTESYTGVKHFAVYHHVTLKNSLNEDEVYTLMLCIPAATALSTINGLISFDGQSVVIMSENGDYIIKTTDFKSTNFYRYLYLSNNLSLDDRNAIESEVRKNESGNLYFKDSESKDCIFNYLKMENGWFCVTCVPMQSFHTATMDVSFTLIIVLLFVALFVIDGFWLLHINRRLKLSAEKEREASKVKSNFLARMSHEIRTPLNAVIGYMAIAQNNFGDEPKMEDCVTKTEIAAKHLLTVINDILDISAIESGKIKIVNDVFNFKQMISSLTVMFYSFATEKNVVFDVHFDSPVDELMIGDSIRINQVLINLLNNAIKFTPADGRVVLGITQRDIDEENLQVEFFIKDSGIGMSQEYMTHLWEPFEQADSSISRKFGGTGLGLAITKAIVDLMGGVINVESKEGEGTTFNVILTLGKTEQPDYAAHYDFTAINALVVDDDESACSYLKLLVNRYNIKCDCAYSGEEALQKISVASVENTPINLCLIDMRMKGMDGMETAKRIKQQFGEDFPMIILSAYDLSVFEEEARRNGIHYFLSKPIFQSTLFDALVGLCGEKQLGVPKSSAKMADLSGVKLLLAEDNQMNMEITVELLTLAGAQIDSAWDGQEAVDKFTSSPKGTYTAILMDVHMPVMDGYTATRAIRTSAHPEATTIPIIAMTANAFEEDIGKSLNCGMNDHLTKPIDEKRLRETIAKFIKK